MPAPTPSRAPAGGIVLFILFAISVSVHEFGIAAHSDLGAEEQPRSHVTSSECVEHIVCERARDDAEPAMRLDDWQVILNRLRAEAEQLALPGPNRWPEIERAYERLQAIGQPHGDLPFSSVLDKAFEQELIAMEDEYPDLVAFDRKQLRAAERALAIAVEDGLFDAIVESSTGRVLLPIQSDEPSPLLLKGGRTLREVTHFVHAVGRVRLHDGDHASWLVAIETTVRLSRAVSRHPTMLARLLAEGIENAAIIEMQNALEHNQLSKEALDGALRVLNDWPVRPATDPVWGDIEAIRMVLRQMFDDDGAIEDDFRRALVEGKIVTAFDLESFGLAAASPAGCDDGEQLRFPDWEEVQSWIDQIAHESSQMRDLPATMTGEVDPIVDRAECVALAPLMESIRNAVGNAVRTRRRTETRRRAVLLATCIESFRATHDNLPDALEQLVPDFIHAVPLDPFTNQPFGYRVRMAHGGPAEYVLYTFGGDGVDNGGSPCDDDTNGWTVVRDGLPPCDVILFAREEAP